jgi:UDP-galactopyranose mutase
LKLKCDEPLSNFVFNFNLRRYTKELGMTSIIIDKRDHIGGNVYDYVTG